MDQPRSSSKRSLKNCNNNSNNSFSLHHGDGKDAELDELGEIHPQVTPEGYGLRTPYGTHFNLDFLKYCQNFAGQDTSGSRSSSGRSSLVSAGSKSESTSDVNDSKGSTESTLWETRRRLDMFRSYRKHKPKPPDHQQQFRYNDYHLRSSGNSSVDDLTISESDPTSPSAKVSSVQQQHLQTVREQMATALNRLKYLENEAKQIPILKVQISVLQQEKTKMAEQIRSYEEATKSKAMTVKKASTPPPPPPRRKYKSVAVGTENAKPNLGFSAVHIEDFKPKKKEEALDGSPKFLKEQFQKFRIRSNASTQTNLAEDTLTDNHSQTDTVTTEDKSTDFSPESADFTTNTHILGIDTITQTILDSNDCATSTDGLLLPGIDRFTNTEFLTVDKSVSFKPITSDFTCYAKVNSGINVETSTDISIECLSNANVVLCDESVQFNPTMSDFSVNVSPITADAYVSANIRPCCKETASQIQSEMTDIGILAKCLVTDFSCNTEVAKKKEIGVSVTPVSADFEVQFDGITNTYDAYTNTDVVEKQDFEMQFQPALVDSAVDPITPVNMSKNDFSVQFQPVVMDSAVDPIGTETKEVTIQVQPETVEVGVDCTVNMANASQQIEDDGARLERNTTKVDGGYQHDDKNSHSCLQCDVATDTSDLNYSPFDGNEIGTYVGQVESLLDEQQSLLAYQYKELGVVLDDRDAATEEHTNKVVVSNIPKVENVIYKKKRYELPPSVRDVCNMIRIGLRSGDNFEENPWADALQVLKEEWFIVSSTEDADSKNIKEFCHELRTVSPKVLSQVVNSLDGTGNCPLHYAVSRKNFVIIATLVDIQEFNVNQYNNAGYTASMLAAITQIETENDVKAVTRLFQRADVCLHAKQAGQTALMLAVSHGCVLSAKLLLDAGADINAQDEDGSTALMCATEHGHIELVKLLLAHPECDPTVADNDGSTAINIAMDAGQRDIGMLLYVHLNLDKSEDS